MNRQTLLRRKLNANRRRLQRPDAIAALEGQGMSASALGEREHAHAAEALRQLQWPEDLQTCSSSQAAEALRELGEGDFLLMFDWDLEEKSSFLMRRNLVAERVERAPDFFSSDGFVALDTSCSSALILDIDEDGSLTLSLSAQPAKKIHAED
jgi:hypothetical protein